MALFDFLGGLFGDQPSAPGAVAPNTQNLQQTISQMVPTITGMAGPAAQANLSYANQMVPGAISAYKAGQSQYDPNIPLVQQGVSKSILGDLMTGYQLPQELSQQSLLKSLGQAARSGFGTPSGLSAGAIGNAARNLGLTGIDWQRQNVNRAQQWLGQQPSPFQLAAQMPTAFTPSQLASLATGVGQAEQQAMDQYQQNLAQYQTGANQFGLSNLLGLAGGIGGAILGAPAGPLGSMGGGSLGGALGRSLLNIFQPSSVGAGTPSYADQLLINM